ncbi:hypothetical protein CHUAL_013586 [Chamberlinius hualienensis]
MSHILLSEGEKTFILHGVQENFRIDGRSQCEYRPMELETDIVSNTNGSARLKLAKTDIVVGIKAELEAPLLDKPDMGKIEFFMDCSAIATPEFEGRGGENLALEVCSTLKRAYQNCDCLDLKSLCIIPKEQCWTVYVDILVLECGGNLFDAVSLAVKAALYSTRISNVSVTVDENGQTELELSDDPFDVKRLIVSDVPCLVTLTKIGNCFVVDPSLEEEACSVSSLVVGVSQSGKIHVTKKVGSGSLHPESILEAIETAAQVGSTLNKQVLEKLKEEELDCSKSERRGFL